MGDYHTQALSLSMEGLTFYCYNHKLINIEEFIDLESAAYLYAFKELHVLFKNCTTHAYAYPKQEYHKTSWMVSIN